MAVDEQKKWDERYSTGDYRPRTESSPLVELAIHYMTPGRALVLACGTGRNALRLADAGFDVEAIDVSPVAIDMAANEAQSRGIEVAWRAADMNEVSLATGRYDLITMVRYTNRSIWRDLITALRPDGWVLLEQHLMTRQEVAGPGDDFRLAPGELLDAFSAMRIIEYFEAFQYSERAEKMTATTGLLACKGDPGW